jgi:hypothetical protein
MRYTIWLLTNVAVYLAYEIYFAMAAAKLYPDMSALWPDFFAVCAPLIHGLVLLFIGAARRSRAEYSTNIGVRILIGGYLAMLPLQSLLLNLTRGPQEPIDNLLYVSLLATIVGGIMWFDNRRKSAPKITSFL